MRRCNLASDRYEELNNEKIIDELCVSFSCSFSSKLSSDQLTTRFLSRWPRLLPTRHAGLRSLTLSPLICLSDGPILLSIAGNLKNLPYLRSLDIGFSAQSKSLDKMLSAPSDFDAEDELEELNALLINRKNGLRELGVTLCSANVRSLALSFHDPTAVDFVESNTAIFAIESILSQEGLKNASLQHFKLVISQFSLDDGWKAFNQCTLSDTAPQLRSIDFSFNGWAKEDLLLCFPPDFSVTLNARQMRPRGGNDSLHLHSLSSLSSLSLSAMSHFFSQQLHECIVFRQLVAPNLLSLSLDGAESPSAILPHLFSFAPRLRCLSLNNLGWSISSVTSQQAALSQLFDEMISRRWEGSLSLRSNRVALTCEVLSSRLPSVAKHLRKLILANTSIDDLDALCAQLSTSLEELDVSKTCNDAYYFENPSASTFTHSSSLFASILSRPLRSFRSSLILQLRDDWEESQEPWVSALSSSSLRELSLKIIIPSPSDSSSNALNRFFSHALPRKLERCDIHFVARMRAADGDSEVALFRKLCEQIKSAFDSASPWPCLHSCNVSLRVERDSTVAAVAENILESRLLSQIEHLAEESWRRRRAIFTLLCCHDRCRRLLPSDTVLPAHSLVRRFHPLTSLPVHLLQKIIINMR